MLRLQITATPPSISERICQSQSHVNQTDAARNQTWNHRELREPEGPERTPAFTQPCVLGGLCGCLEFGLRTTAVVDYHRISGMIAGRNRKELPHE